MDADTLHILHPTFGRSHIWITASLHVFILSINYYLHLINTDTTHNTTIDTIQPIQPDGCLTLLELENYKTGNEVDHYPADCRNEAVIHDRL